MPKITRKDGSAVTLPAYRAEHTFGSGNERKVEFWSIRSSKRPLKCVIHDDVRFRALKPLLKLMLCTFLATSCSSSSNLLTKSWKRGSTRRMPSGEKNGKYILRRMMASFSGGVLNGIPVELCPHLKQSNEQESKKQLMLRAPYWLCASIS